MSWDEAGAHLDERATVCGPVAGSRSTGDALFLNLGVDYPDPDRFTIVVWGQQSDEATWRDAEVCATGDITSYEDVPQIRLQSLDGVTVTRAPSPTNEVSDPVVGDQAGTSSCDELDYPQLAYPGRSWSVDASRAFDEHTRVVQDGLNYLGYGCLDEDGHFGSRTQDAIKRFQADSDLAVDGVVGEQTYSRLTTAAIAGGDGCVDPC